MGDPFGSFDHGEGNMKFIRYTVCIMIFLIACPIGWFAAWVAPGGTILGVGFSVLIPTFGLAYWGASHLFESGFMVMLVAGPLGMLGAFVSLMMYKILIPDSEK
jgi:hypothetical protein